MRLDHKSIATPDSSGGNARKERCVLVEGQTTVCRIFNWLFEIVWDDRPRAIGAACERRRERPNPRQTSMPVVIGSGSHPFPFRTRKLSLIPPMVLHGKLCGRVGRCRQSIHEGPMRCRIGPFCLYAALSFDDEWLSPRLRERSTRLNSRFSGCRRLVPARSESKEAQLTLAAERPRDTQE